MISYGEVFFVLAAAVALFGPKDIPIIARSAGRFVGKAVGYMQSMRGQLDDVIKLSQVDQVHKELQETMAQLEAIRHEIRSGISITNPGPLTRTVLNVDLKSASRPSPSAQSQADVKQTPHIPISNSSVSNQWPGSVSDTQVVLEMQELLRASSDPILHFETVVATSTAKTSVPTTLGKPVGFQPGSDGSFDTMPPSTARVAAQRIVVKPIGIKTAPSPQPPTTSSEYVQDITVLPISAVSAGLLPPRTGQLSGGADLVLESVTERRVAFDTLEFFQQSEPMRG